jgi:hypothetical protein
MLPSTFINLDPYEKAFVIASINTRIESEKEQQKKAKRAKKK